MPTAAMHGCEKKRMYIEITYTAEATYSLKNKLSHISAKIRPDLDVRFFAKPTSSTLTSVAIVEKCMWAKRKTKESDDCGNTVYRSHYSTNILHSVSPKTVTSIIKAVTMITKIQQSRLTNRRSYRRRGQKEKRQ